MAHNVNRSTLNPSPATKIHFNRHRASAALAAEGTKTSQKEHAAASQKSIGCSPARSLRAA